MEWAKKLGNGHDDKWKVIPDFLTRKLGGRSFWNTRCNITKAELVKHVNIPFWTRVLTTWISFTWEDKMNQLNISENIFMNNYLVFKNQPFYCESLIHQNATLISDYFVNGRIITLNELNYNGIEMDYNIIYNALKNCNINMDKTALCTRMEFISRLSRIEIYEKFNNTTIVNHVPNAWKNRGLEFNNSHWEVAYKSTKEVFQDGLKK